MLDRRFGNRDITIATTITKLLTLKIPKGPSTKVLLQGIRLVEKRAAKLPENYSRRWSRYLEEHSDKQERGVFQLAVYLIRPHEG